MTIVEQLEQIGRALTVDDVARLLAMHKLSVYRLCSRGSLPHYRIGTCLRFDPHSIAKYLREREVRG
jgi:excisionase family DNA binding protein